MCFVRYQFFAGCTHHGLVLQQCCEDAIIVTLDDLQVLVDHQPDGRYQRRTVEFLLKNNLIPNDGTSSASKASSTSSIDHAETRSHGQGSIEADLVVGNHSRNSSGSWESGSLNEDRDENIQRIYDKWMNQRPPCVVREFVSDGCWQVECPDINPDDIEVEAEPCENLWTAVPDERTGRRSTVFALRDDDSLSPPRKSDGKILGEVDQSAICGGTKREPETTEDHNTHVQDDISAPMISFKDITDDAQSLKISWADMVEEEEGDKITGPTQNTATEDGTSNAKLSTSEADDKDEEQDPAKRVWRRKWRDALPEISENWRKDSSSPHVSSRYVQAPPIEPDDLKENSPFSYKSSSTSRTSSTYVKASPMWPESRSTSRSSSYRLPIVPRATTYVEPLPKGSASSKESRSLPYRPPAASFTNALVSQTSVTQAAIRKGWTEPHSLGAEGMAPGQASVLSPYRHDMETSNEAPSNVQRNEASLVMVQSEIKQDQAIPRRSGIKTSKEGSAVHGLIKSIGDGPSHSASRISTFAESGESLDKRPASPSRLGPSSKQSISSVRLDATTEPFPRLSEPAITRRQSHQLVKAREGSTCNNPSSAVLAGEGISAGSFVPPRKPYLMPVVSVVALTIHVEGFNSRPQQVLQTSTDVDMHAKFDGDMSNSSTPERYRDPRRRSQTVKKRKNTSGLAIDVLRTEQPKSATAPKPIELDTDSPSAFPTLGASVEQTSVPPESSTPNSVRRRRMSSIINAATRRRGSSQADTVSAVSRESLITFDDPSLPMQDRHPAAESSGNTAPQEKVKPKASVSPTRGPSNVSMCSERSSADKLMSSGSSSVRDTVQSYSAIVKSFTPVRGQTTNARELKRSVAEDWPEIPPEEDWAKQRARLGEANCSESLRKVHPIGTAAQSQHSEDSMPAREEGSISPNSGVGRRAKTPSESLTSESVDAQASVPLKERKHVVATPDTSERVRTQPGEDLNVKEEVSNASERQLLSSTQQDVTKEYLTEHNKELRAKQTWRATVEVSNIEKAKVSDPNNQQTVGTTEKVSKTGPPPKVSKPTRAKGQPKAKTGSSPTSLSSLPETPSQPTQLSRAEIYTRQAPAPPLLPTSRDRSWASVLRSRSPAVSQTSSRCSSITAGEYVTPPHTPQHTTFCDNLGQETPSSNSDGYHSAQEDVKTTTDPTGANPTTPTLQTAMNDHQDAASTLKELSDESSTPTRNQTPKPSRSNLVSSNSDDKENIVPEFRRSIPSVDTGARTISIIPFEAQCRYIDCKLMMWKDKIFPSVSSPPQRILQVAVPSPLTYAEAAAAALGADQPTTKEGQPAPGDETDLYSYFSKHSPEKYRRVTDVSRHRTGQSSTIEALGNTSNARRGDNNPITSIVPSQRARGGGGRPGENAHGYPKWYQHAPVVPPTPSPMTLDAVRNQIRGAFPQDFIPRPVPNHVQYYPAAIDPTTGQYIMPPMPQPMQMDPLVPQAAMLPGVIYSIFPPLQPMIPIYNPGPPDLQFIHQGEPYHLGQQTYAGQQQVPLLHPYIAAQIPRHNQTMMVHHHSSPTRGRDPPNYQVPGPGQTMQVQHFPSPTHGFEQPRSSLGSSAPRGSNNTMPRRVGELMTVGPSSSPYREHVESLGPGQVIVNNPTPPYPLFENDEARRRSEGLWVDTVGNFSFGKPEWPRAQYLGGAWRTYMPTEQDIAEKNTRMQLTYESGLEIWHVGQQVRKIQMCQNPVFEYVGWVNDGMCPVCAPDQHH
ncbi:MAG: hypothetical protein M1836_006731 [Candelina mexicana]|nr:MAG: hypothetical protein M1836_006731 [Candelina mexicana]